MGSTPIHDVSEDRNCRIKEFYWKLWFSNETPMPEIDVHGTFIGPEVARFISGQVETFCGRVAKVQFSSVQRPFLLNQNQNQLPQG